MQDRHALGITAMQVTCVLIRVRWRCATPQRRFSVSPSLCASQFDFRHTLVWNTVRVWKLKLTLVLGWIEGKEGSRCVAVSHVAGAC
eukprot:209029-Amphidinium_carterae.1